jgi:hypothetical protein
MKDLKYDHIWDADPVYMNKRERKEKKKSLGKQISPHSSISTQSMTPVKRPSRFESFVPTQNSEEIDPLETKSKSKLIL